MKNENKFLTVADLEKLLNNITDKNTPIMIYNKEKSTSTEPIFDNADEAWFNRFKMALLITTI